MFSITENTPSVALPGVFFPLITLATDETALSQQPTVSIDPAASEKVIIIIGNNWKVYTLTAGTATADATHILPLDYDATTNAKHWLVTSTGYVVGNALIDSSGNVLIDSSGNPLTFG